MKEKQSGDSPAPRADRRSFSIVLGLMIYAALVALYFWIRFQGHWIEQDTSVFVRAIDYVADEATIFPKGFLYQNGFNFQVTAAALGDLAGVSSLDLLTKLSPFLIIASVPLAFSLYRELIGSARGGLIATSLLLFQSEYLFSFLRGNHEKLTLPLAMLALFLLVKSFKMAGRPVVFAIYVGLFYLTAFALVATNVFFGTSFVVAITISFLVGRLVSKRLEVGGEPNTTVPLVRLTYTAAACTIIVFVFVFYLYAPATAVMELPRTIMDKLASLLLAVEPVSSPYNYVTTYWISPWVYLAMTALGWIILFLAGVEWLVRLRLFLVNPKAEMLRSGLLGWTFFFAFAPQLAISVFLDYLGFLGSNLQVRLLPTMILIAIPLATSLLLRSSERLRKRPRLGMGVRLAVMALVAWFAVASILKATNEPTLNSKWLYYTSAESTAIRWTDLFLRYSSLWVGSDERLREVFNSQLGKESTSGNLYDTFSVDQATRYFLISDLVRSLSVRLSEHLPETDSQLRIYDSGSVQIYHTRPVTPYQK